MDKFPASPPTSEATSTYSPTLSDHPKNNKKIKRKRTNIFSKLRKSILGASSNDDDEDTNDNIEKRNNLKRAMSIDSGLQNRISQLITSTAAASTSRDNPADFDPQTQIKRHSSVRNRRSKSLHHRNNSLEQIVETCSNIGTAPPSPAVLESDDAILTINTPLLTRTASLIDTVDVSNTQATVLNQRFNCSWLAPTRHPQLFPGTLSLHHHSSSIQFHCQHFNRTIRLQLHFHDILNIAQGTWNEARNQALIIDLVKGKRKSWVFVAWSDDHFLQAVECFVQAWDQFTINHVHQRIDRKNAHLNMKYCKIIRDADRANESTKSKLSLILQETVTAVKDHYFKCFQKDSDVQLITNSQPPEYSLKNLIHEGCVDFVIPQVLGSILTDRASNFMTNYRALNGIVITNDSGWKIGQTKKRTFNCLINKEDDRLLAFKWRITQELLIDDPDLVVIRSTYSPVNSSKPSNFTLISSISNIENHFRHPKCSIKITGELKRRGNIFFTEDQLCQYFRDNFYKPLFVLLEAFISESQNDFQTFQTDFLGESVLPQYRFLKETIKNRLLLLNVGFTTVILPFLYKLIHFREYKFARLLILVGILYYLINFISFKSIWDSIKVGRERSFDDAFRDYMKEITKDAQDGEGTIHSLKLKYGK